MDEYDFADFAGDSSFYDHHQLSSLPMDGQFYDFVTPNMPNSMMRSSLNVTSKDGQDLSYPPVNVDSILYSPLDDWNALPEYTNTDSLGLNNLFDESPLMSTLGRHSTIDSTTDTTSPLVQTPLSASPPRPHTDIAGWEPSPDSKRSRATTEGDSKSACWTSNLCPAFGKPGPHPDPSTCEGGCATNMFGDQTMEQWFDNLTKSSEDGANILDASTTGVEDTLPELVADTADETTTELDDSVIKTEDDTTKKILNARKRKPNNKRGASEDSVTVDQTAGSPSSRPTTTKPSTTKTSRRQPHNEIEKKYRESINTHLEALKNSLPAFHAHKDKCLKGEGDIEDLAAAPKPSKSIILASAVSHIKKIEKERKQLEQERNALRQQVKALQALVKCDDCGLMQYVVGLNGLNLGNNNNLVGNNPAGPNCDAFPGLQ